jgi:hypothetical protein
VYLHRINILLALPPSSFPIPPSSFPIPTPRPFSFFGPIYGGNRSSSIRKRKGGGGDRQRVATEGKNLHKPNNFSSFALWLSLIKFYFKKFWFIKNSFFHFPLSVWLWPVLVQEVNVGKMLAKCWHKDNNYYSYSNN